MEVSTNSHKDPKPNTDPELGFPVKSIHKEDCKTSMAQKDHRHNCMTTTLKTLPVQECDQDYQEEELNQLCSEFNNIVVPLLVLATPPSSPNLKLEKLKISSDEKKDNNNDLKKKLRTPTSSDHKIPTMLDSPGAPRKTTRLSSMKRKAASSPGPVSNLSKKLESMFAKKMLDFPGEPRKITRSSSLKQKAASSPGLVSKLSKKMKSMFTSSFMEDINKNDSKTVS